MRTEKNPPAAGDTDFSWRIVLQDRKDSLQKYTTDDERHVAFKTALADLRALLGSRILTNLEKFSSVVDRFLPGAPFPAALVWGVVFVVFTLIKGDHVVYDKLFEDLGSFDAQVEFAFDACKIGYMPKRMQDILGELYALIVKYWTEALKVCKLRKRRLLLPGWVGMKFDYHSVFAPIKNEITDRSALFLKVLQVHIAKNVGTILEVQRKTQWTDFTQDLGKMVCEYSRWLDDKSLCRLPGTCLWISQKAEYQQWLRGEKYALWLVGDPGSGKTTLATRLITEAQANRTATVYCLCMYDRPRTLLTDEILRSFCFQMFQYHSQSALSDQTAELLLALFHKYGGTALEGYKRTQLCLQELFEFDPDTEITIFVDGLDEAENREIDKLVTWLWTLYPKYKERLRIFLSSRRNFELIELLVSNRMYGDKLTQLDVDVNGVMDDIKIFVAEALKLRPRISDDFTEEENNQWEQQRLKVIEDLPLISNGQFQWAHLIVSEMNQCFNRSEVDQLLREGYMPQTLNEMYTRIIYRLNASLSRINFEKAKCLLRWCACSVRPLRLEEIADLLILRETIGWYAEDAESLGRNSGVPLKTWTPELCAEYEYQVQKICGCLLHFRPSEDERPGTSTLHFVHLSAKEFLTSVNRETIMSAPQAKQFNTPIQDGAEIPFLVNPQQENADLFWDCMVYLSQPCFQGRIVKIRGDPFLSSKIIENHPFLVYAATSWPLHLRLSENTSIETTRSRIQRFFSGTTIKTWMEIALALKDGLEWLHLIGLAIKEWVSNSSDAQTDVSAFENWAVDVAGFSFMDYEATLLHNTNEVHYLDRRILFSNSVNSCPSRFHESKAIQERFQDLAKDENLKLPDDVYDLSPASPVTNFPGRFFLGELGYSNYGYISQDLNLPDFGGILLVDRTLNHPRLVWERLPSSSDLSQTGARQGVRLASVCRSSKLYGHNLWTTVSGALSPDGTAFAAVFSEPHPENANLKHFKIVLWQFEVTGEDERALQYWRNSFHSGKLSTAPQRPAIPSTASVYQTSMNWTTAYELQPKEGDVLADVNGIFANSKHLVAFHDSGYLVTPGGIFNISIRLPVSNPWNQVGLHIKFEATVVPGAEAILGFEDDSRRTLVVVPLMDGDPYGAVGSPKVVDASSLIGDGASFEHIVGCSESGTHVCLTMHTADDEFLVGVLTLEDDDFEVIFRSASLGEIQVANCIFDRGREPAISASEMWEEHLDAEERESTQLSENNLGHKRRPNEVQYVAFVIKEKSIADVYTLLAYSLDDSCLVLQKFIPEEPEGLLFFQSPNGISLVSLARGRQTSQYALENCLEDQSIETITNDMSAESRTLTSIDFDMAPSVDGKRLGFTSLELQSRPRRGVPRNSYTTEVTIHSWSWERGLRSNDCPWTLRLETNLKFDPMCYGANQLQEHGIVLSQDLTKTGLWVGPTLSFLALPASTVFKEKGLIEPAVEQICIGLQFNSSGNTAASLWRCESEKRWKVCIHSFTFDEVSTTASVTSGGEPQGLAFHPSQSRLSVSSLGELRIFQILPDGSLQLLHKLTTDLLQGPFKVHKSPNGPASPPSTESTATAPHVLGEDDFDFQYSSCGQFLFTQSWNRFVDAKDVTPDTGGMNLIDRLHAKPSQLWTQIPPNHPRIMKENRLYATGEHRFKIFKIRSYLVLGWSADGTNLWSELGKTPTWYRRVLCAIPLSLGNWRAALIWPKAPRHLLTVLFYPPESFAERRQPVSITTHLQASQLHPDYPGWLQGHAAGCPYHLKDNL